MVRESVGWTPLRQHKPWPKARCSPLIYHPNISENSPQRVHRSVTLLNLTQTKSMPYDKFKEIEHRDYVRYPPPREFIENQGVLAESLYEGVAPREAVQ